MIKEKDVYKIGRLGKTHGVRGDISFPGMELKIGIADRVGRLVV